MENQLHLDVISSSNSSLDPLQAAASYIHRQRSNSRYSTNIPDSLRLKFCGDKGPGCGSSVTARSKSLDVQAAPYPSDLWLTLPMKVLVALGHDLFPVLCWEMKEHRPLSLGSVETVNGKLRVSNGG